MKNFVTDQGMNERGLLSHQRLDGVRRNCCAAAWDGCFYLMAHAWGPG